MAEPWEWVESDLDNLLQNRIGESTVLDYKAREALQNRDRNKLEISKDVSAFANSAGGTLVYGIDETNHVPSGIRGMDPAVISREWLEQVINSGIQRRIDGIRINQIPLDTVEPRHVAYVVSIPQSLRAPHMAADKRFYKRFNFESVPMEEYEVRDVGRRDEVPDLWLEFDLWPDPNGSVLNFKGDDAFSDPVQFIAHMVNRSVAMAHYALIGINVDKQLRPVTIAGRLWPDDYAAWVGDSLIPSARYTINWSPPNFMPIWEGLTLRLGETPFSVMFPRAGGSYYLSWTIRAPAMPPHSGVVTFVSDGETVSLR